MTDILLLMYIVEKMENHAHITPTANVNNLVYMLIYKQGFVDVTSLRISLDYSNNSSINQNP